MKRKFQSITNALVPASAVILLLLLWQGFCMAGVLPEYMLPSPVQVVQAFVQDFSLMVSHMWTTLFEAFAGLGIGIVLGFFVAFLMEQFTVLYRALYPILVITQTIPTLAIAPLIVLWMGYNTAPKITLVVIMTFFPITVGLLDGFKEADPDAVRLLKAMGASKHQIFVHIMLPSALGHFFAGLRMSVSYAVVGAVVAEWLGGFAGLGVYMTRVKKSYAYDRMFAVIFLITAISILLMKLVDVMQTVVMPWKRAEKEAHVK
ncbi:ABC transporter permease [Jutongia sp.]